MTQPQKNSALVLAMIAGLISLPMTWMTIQQVEWQGGFGPAFIPPFGGMKFDVTGLNGSVTFLVKTPIWFIVGVAISASLLQLMQESQTFAVPKFAIWMTPLLAVGWVLIVITLALFSGKATLGLGSLLGLFAAVVPAVCAVMQSSPERADDSKSLGEGIG